MFHWVTMNSLQSNLFISWILYMMTCIYVVHIMTRYEAKLSTGASCLQNKYLEFLLTMAWIYTTSQGNLNNRTYLKQLTMGSLFHLHCPIAVNCKHSVFWYQHYWWHNFTHFINCKFITTFDKFDLCTSSCPRLDLMGYMQHKITRWVLCLK